MTTVKQAILMSAICLAIAGCDYETPLVERPGLDIDPSLLGLWETTTSSGQVQALLILPLGKREYLVSFPAGSKDAMFARASHWHGSGMDLVQLDWFGTAQAQIPDNNRTYQYVAYEFDGDSIATRLLNPKVALRNVRSAAALAQAIADKKDHSGLFRDEMVFRKAERR